MKYNKLSDRYKSVEHYMNTVMFILRNEYSIDLIPEKCETNLASLYYYSKYDEKYYIDEGLKTPALWFIYGISDTEDIEEHFMKELPKLLKNANRFNSDGEFDFSEFDGMKSIHLKDYNEKN